MDYPDYTTEHQKGKHLTYEDYVKIQMRLQDGWSANFPRCKILTNQSPSPYHLVRRLFVEVATKFWKRLFGVLFIGNGVCYNERNIGLN